MALRKFYSTLMLLVLVACVNARTFYEVLGVEKNATPRELKKGYMKQVLKYHPDKNDAPDATQKFMEVTTAYECLSDPELRKKYDMIGHDAYVGTKQSESKSQERQEQHDDPFSKFESFFRSEQKHSSSDDGGEDDDFFKSFFSEFEDTFESHGFGGGGAQFMSRKTFRRSGAGGIKMEMDGFLNMDDILFDPFWNGEEVEDDPVHFGSGRSFFGSGHFAPSAHHAFFDAPHSSAHASHARAHAHAHQHHHNRHQHNQNIYQQHHNIHQQHHNMHQNHIHKHNLLHQHQRQSMKQRHPNQFHHQQEFKFFSSDEDDGIGDEVFGFSNVFSDSSSAPKEFSFKSSSSSSTGGGGSRSSSQKTYSYESTSSTSGSADGSKVGGRRQTCTVSMSVDSMGNMRESKTCS